MGHVWVTDCDSLYEHLISARDKMVDNMLTIHLAALRQNIWEVREGMGTTTAHSDKGDYPRWKDTSAMVADSLTKVICIRRGVGEVRDERCVPRELGHQGQEKAA